MHITGIISALIVGLIVGALGRLVVPGANPMGILLTILLGIVGAIIGGFIGAAITSSWIIIFILQGRSRGAAGFPRQRNAENDGLARRPGAGRGGHRATPDRAEGGRYADS